MKLEIHVHEQADGQTLVAITALKGEIMKKFEDVLAAMAAIDTATNAIGATVAVVVQKEVEQLTEIQALKDQIAQGVPVTQEQLDMLAARAEAAGASLTAVHAALEGIAHDPNDPVPEDPPVDPPADPPVGEGEGGEGSGGEAGEGGGGEPEGSGNQSTARAASMERKGGLR